MAGRLAYGLGRVALATVVRLCVPEAGAMAQGTAPEHTVKAAFLTKFIPFIDWPASAFDPPEAPVTLCVVGEDPFGELLDHAVGEQAAGERPVTLQRLRQADREAGCHIMYIGGSDIPTVARALDTVRGLPVLTVTDQFSDTRAKGIINFVLRENRVRFEIDNDAALENKVLISSKLLSLALSVKLRK